MPDGDLTVIAGPMYAGKTGELIDRLQRRDHVAFKPIIDDRYGEEQVVTHDGTELPATPVRTDAEGMDALVDLALGRDPAVVGIDEAQFFDTVLVNAVVRLRESGLDVIA
ncbi:MAG: thymidine kinase, partial [Candidatus Nanohaloarchaea archaeon]